MADVYLRSTDGNDADDGSTWALADATLAASIAAAGAAGRSFMSDNHAESLATTQTYTATSGHLQAVICVDDAGDPQPPTALATTGSVLTTGAHGQNFGAGQCAFYGFALASGSGNSSGFSSINFFQAAAQMHYQWRSCTLTLASTFSGDVLNVSQTATSHTNCLVELYACDFQINQASQHLTVSGPFRWYGGTYTLGVVPTRAFFTAAVGATSSADIRGVDLSHITSTLVFSQEGRGGYFDILNCKLNASVTPVEVSAPAGPGRPRVRLHNCNAGDVNTDLYEEDAAGHVASNTSVSRDGGTLVNGTTSLSHQMVGRGNQNYVFPLYGPPYLIPIYQPGSYTLTVEFVHDSATALHDGDIWPEVEYQGTSEYPQSALASGRRPILPTTTTNWASSSVTWTGTGGFTNPNKQKMTLAFTTAEVGWVTVRVASTKTTSVYIDPPTRASVA